MWFELRSFWGHHARPDGRLSDACFSQWWPCRFVVDGAEYSSAEQYMMAKKARLFAAQDALLQIMNAKDPGKVKSLGRRAKLRANDLGRGALRSVRLDVGRRGKIRAPPTYYAGDRLIAG